MTQPAYASFLVGERVFLRSLEEGDLDRLCRWHNDSELYRQLLGVPWPTSRAAVADWLARKTAYCQTEWNLAICAGEDREHIGNIYLRDIDWVARRAEVHIFLGQPEWRGQGLGQESLRLVCRHAFQSLGLRRIFLHVLADNTSAIHAYEKIGFRSEGRLRQHAFKAGEPVDVCAMGLLAGEIVERS